MSNTFFQGGEKNFSYGPAPPWTFSAYGITSHCRMWACLFCIFVPPPTSLIKVVNLGSFHWACHCSYIFVSCWSSAFCRWRESKNIVRSNSSPEYVLSRFTRAHPLEAELSSAIYFFKFNSYQIECSSKYWVCIEQRIWISIQWTVPIREFQTNDPVTQTNMNKPSTQRINWRYHCSATCVT